MKLSRPRLVQKIADEVAKKFNNEAVFELKPYKLHKLDSGPSTQVTVTRDEALKLLTKMDYIRQMEKACRSLYLNRFMRGFCHLYLGQEACAVGVHSMMKPVDSVMATYRCHAWGYLMTDNMRGVFGELVGRETGICQGKGGSMHIYHKKLYGGQAIVGTTAPLGAGVAFASKYLNDGGVCCTMYGDGSANQGQTFESFNMAKLWSLPCLYICENNLYGMGTSAVRSSASTEYYKRGDYIPGILADGMDVLATREAARFALDYCRSGKGPFIIEYLTYRYAGHSMSDPGTSYRKKEEVQTKRKTSDPIGSFRTKLVEKNLTSREELKQFHSKIKKEVKEIALLVQSDKELKLEELAGNVYEKCDEPEIRGVNPWQKWKHLSTKHS